MIYSILFFVALRLASSIKLIKISWPETGLLLIAISSLILYAGGISSLYVHAQYLVSIAILALALFAVFKKKITINFNDYFAILIIIISSFLAYHHSLQLHDWDEISHWGTVQKILKITHNLSTNTAFDMGASYIPGYSIWVDFLSSDDIKQEFSLYSASSGFLWTYFFFVSFVVFKKDDRKYSELSIPLLLFTYSFLWLTIKANSTPYTIYTLCVDFPLAVFLTGAIVSLLVDDFIPSSILLITSCILLTLSKQIGFLFSIITVILWFITFYGKSHFRKKALVTLISALLIIFAIKYSWDWHLARANIVKIFNENKLSPASIQNLLLNFKDDSLMLIILEKIKKSFLENYLFKLSFFGIFILSIFRSIKYGHIKIDYLLFYVLSVGCYLSILILSYRLLFGDYEAARIASFDRYIDSMLLPWCLFISACLIKYADRFINRIYQFKKTKIIIQACLVISLFPQLNLHVATANHPLTLRPKLKEWVELIRPKITTQQKLFFIRQNSDGFECLIMKYELYPNAVGCEAWSVGKPFSAADVWTANLSLEDLRARIAKYDFVLVANDEGSLWSDYGSLFDKHAIGLFRVETSIKSNEISLKFIN